MIRWSFVCFRLQGLVCFVSVQVRDARYLEFVDVVEFWNLCSLPFPFWNLLHLEHMNSHHGLIVSFICFLPLWQCPLSSIFCFYCLIIIDLSALMVRRVFSSRPWSRGQETAREGEFSCCKYSFSYLHHSQPSKEKRSSSNLPARQGRAHQCKQWREHWHGQCYREHNNKCSKCDCVLVISRERNLLQCVFSSSWYILVTFSKICEEDRSRSHSQSEVR